MKGIMIWCTKKIFIVIFMIVTYCFIIGLSVPLCKRYFPGYRNKQPYIIIACMWPISMPIILGYWIVEGK